jgi:threonine dehydrogenase-like Zn-dependent dehydrogenase
MQGQAEYLRVPHADVGQIKIESDLPDEKVLFLSDIFPTGYMAAENAEIKRGETVKVWGCGPVVQMAIQSCWRLGAGRVIAIDRVPERLAMAGKQGKAETINFDQEDVYERLNAMTEGRGSDRCIDAVGCEAHGTGGVDAVLDNLKAGVKLATDRTHVIRQAIFCCRKEGYVSVPWGLCGDDRQNAARCRDEPMNKGLTIKTGQTHVQR